jgi:ubiquitin C-terminal hydrolase
MDFGHYYAYININNKWFEFNDDIVREINMEFSSSTAYVFLYQREE